MTLQRLARLAAALALAAQVARAQEAAGGVDVPDAPPPPAPAGEAAVEAPPAEASRTLGGRVVDARTRQALPSASVAVQGTQISSGVDAEGRFTLAGVPLESFVLAVQERGHQPRELRVGPDARSVTVELSESYVEELVGVGGATQVARRNLANAVSTVSAEDLVRAPAATVDGALQGKVAGANIQSNSGAPGGGLQVRLRGVSTISGQSSPLYVLDGVIVSDAAIPSGIHAVLPLSPGPNPAFLPDDPVNRIADLDPNDIENVEVLKGASAAAIYGSKASNGVVIITTRKGRPGSEPRLQLTQRAGAYQLSRELGARAYGSAEEAEAQWPGLGARYWTPAVFDHERELAGRTDLSTETLASLSGAAGATTNYASGILKGDKGIISGTGYDKQGLRLNLDRRLGDALELSLGTNVLHTLARRGVANDNPGVSPYTVLSSTPSFFDLQPNATGSYPANPFAGAVETNPLQTAGLMKNDEDVWRLLGSAGARWRLWSSAHHELKLQLGLGADRFQQTNDILFPAALFFEPLDGLPGTALFASTEVLNVNAGAHLVHTFRPSGHGWLSSATTSAGYQQESQDRSSAYVASRSIPSGSQNVGSGLQITVTQNRRRVLDRGFYLQEEALALGERLYLVAALRAEQSSLDGNPRALDLFPRGAASYRVPGLPSPFDELKLRAAYGETGNLSPYGNALTPPPGTMPLKDIHPERQRELEVGVDALMFSGTTIAELTAYQEVVSDLILQRPLAPATGFTTEIVQGGELVNRGVEAMLQVTPFQSAGGATWTSRATFALNRSLVTRLPIPAFNTGGFGVAAGTFRIEQGQSATQIAGHDVDENGNLVVTKLGDAEPDFRMSFLNDVRYGAFTLSTSFEWQQGSQVINLTRLLYDAAGNSPDDVTAGSARFNRWLNGRTREYVEDATFFKVREVTLSYEIPPSFYDRYLEAVRHARVSVSGRNLLAFTPYSGLDPEVSSFGNQPLARNIDVAPFPPSRSLWASIQLGF